MQSASDTTSNASLPKNFVELPYNRKAISIECFYWRFVGQPHDAGKTCDQHRDVTCSNPDWRPAVITASEPFQQAYRTEGLNKQLHSLFLMAFKVPCRIPASLKDRADFRNHTNTKNTKISLHDFQIICNMY
jgi:hypothetical protein